jgi:hypothetical protein
VSRAPIVPPVGVAARELPSDSVLLGAMSSGVFKRLNVRQPDIKLRNTVKNSKKMRYLKTTVNLSENSPMKSEGMENAPKY